MKCPRRSFNCLRIRTGICACTPHWRDRSNGIERYRERPPVSFDVRPVRSRAGRRSRTRSASTAPTAIVPARARAARCARPGACPGRRLEFDRRPPAIEAARPARGVRARRRLRVRPCDRRPTTRSPRCPGRRPAVRRSRAIRVWPPIRLPRRAVCSRRPLRGAPSVAVDARHAALLCERGTGRWRDVLDFGHAVAAIGWVVGTIGVRHVLLKR